MKQDTDRSRRDRQRRRRKQKQTQWLIALLAVVILAVAAVLIWQSTKPEATRGDARSHGNARAHRGT